MRPNDITARIFPEGFIRFSLVGRHATIAPARDSL